MIAEVEQVAACPENDRANTNEAVDEGVYLNGGSFSFTFPVEPGKQVISGSVAVREEGGAVTTYTYRPTRCAGTKATAVARTLKRPEPNF